MTELAAPEQSTFRIKALASIAATAGMYLLPIAYIALETFGPSSRVEYFGYLPSPTAINYPIAGLLGAWLGATHYRLRDPQNPYSVGMLVTGCVLGSFLGLVVLVIVAAGPSVPSNPIFGYVAFMCGAMAPVIGAWLGGIHMFKPTTNVVERRRFPWLQSAIVSIFIVWVLLPQFRAFPEDGTLAERDAWTEQHVPQYASLKRTIEKIPAIRESVGRIVGIAPAAGAKHIAASDMDGVGMNFTLDVVGEKGSGVLRVNCGVDGDQIYRWEPATWTFNGQAVEITTVANLVKRGG
jgi:hypothetical protein